jgi:uncharacterized protein (TIGR02001 family)
MTMQKSLIAVAVAGAIAVPLAAVADDAAAPPPSPWSFNVGVVSDYLFRGVSQTHGDPALQAGVTYTHPSGFYANLWGSNITWVKDALGSGSVEVDLSAGFKNTFGDSKLGYDVGYYTYNYPGYGSTLVVGNNAGSFIANPNTQELYGALTYDLGNNNSLMAKYSYTTSQYFIGWYNPLTGQDSRGSGYAEVDGTFDLGNGWGLTAHAGHQTVANWSAANYSDVNVGVTKDVGFGVVGLLVSTTDASSGCDAGTNSTLPGTSNYSPYCWGNNGNGATVPTTGWRNVAKSTAVLSFSKTF